jgi:hypothetical protein
MALLGRPGEVQGLGDRQKIADLVHLHALTVPGFPWPRKAGAPVAL